MMSFVERQGRLSPTALAFSGSLLLSLVAIAGAVTVGRDAALYLHAAQQALEHGPRAAFPLFDWPWFSLLLAGTHWLTAVPLESAGYLWCALFTAGTCALLVSVSERFVAGSGYWASLVVLSIPAFNQFRDDIIREPGFWFFSILALSLALRWLESGGWLRAAALQMAIGGAALFRLEAVILVPALTLCLLAEFPGRQGWMRLLQLNALPLAAALIALVAAGQGISQSRVDYYLSLIDPHRFVLRFDLMANQFAVAALEKYSTDDARQIVFFGLAFTLLSKFFLLNGPLLLPLLYPAAWPGVRDYWRKLRPFAWAWLLFFCVLLLFFVQQRFINSRYVSFLNLLAVPVLTIALLRFAGRFPRGSRLLVALVVLVMLHNVISLGARKTHYLEAGAWLSQHTHPADPIFYDDQRIAYYAGRGYPQMPVTREQALTAGQSANFRYFVLTAKPGDPTLKRWLAEQHKQILEAFSNRKGDTVVIIGD